MKKHLLLSVMALVGLSASAQFNYNPSVVPQTNSKVVNMPQTQRSYQAVAPLQGLTKRVNVPNRMLTLDAVNNLKPVTSAERKSLATRNQIKAMNLPQAQNRRFVNLQAAKNQQSSTRAKAARKAYEFPKSYTGVAYDYFADADVQWEMIPSTEAEVFTNFIPTPKYLSELYPEGIPVEYIMEDDQSIIIEPQFIAKYQNEAGDTTFYVTLFSYNNERKPGVISMEVDKSGKLTVTNGDMICLGEFANVEFDENFKDEKCESFLGLDEVYAGVSYYYQYEVTVDQEYDGQGFSYFENKGVEWVMQRCTSVMDGEESHYFIDMVPCPKAFAELYPNGIDVDYEVRDNVITVKPQVIAHSEDEDGEFYVLVFSAQSSDGSIVLTMEEDGNLTTIKNEKILIGAWATNEYDPTFSTYLGGYIYIQNVKYRLPGAPAEAPEDVAFEPEELVLFVQRSYSGYGYTDNIAVMGAYAPTTFSNLTTSTATGFKWSVKETDDDDNETIITGDERDFTLTTKGGAVYEEFSLTGYNEDAVSEPYIWGASHMETDDDGNPTDVPIFEDSHAYAGHGASSFVFSDGTYAVMTRQDPDYERTFYINWATPDIFELYSDDPTSMSTIYSYQGKPSTPLYLTGVTLPMVEFSAKDDFNLHIKLCKCERSASGSLTLGDVIAEGDATIDNVVADYAEESGIAAVEFPELYVEDEFGMSETVDYLFIEDEFVIVIEGWDNGTFSGVLGSHTYSSNGITSTWFKETGDDESMYSYGGGWPQLFIGLLDATYGYLYTEDPTELSFDVEGGASTIHVNPMYYSEDDETGETTYLLYTESITVDGEEAEEIPEWLDIEVANEDYTKATAIDEDGDEYEYFVNGIDYDLVFTAEALPEGVEYRTAEIVFMQPGARLTVTITQGIDPDGISTVVASTPIKNSRAFNLAGQPVGKNYKGIVVKNGKKVIVK